MSDPHLPTAIAFLRSICLAVVEGPAPVGCFFPGVWYQGGGLAVDPAIATVGDLLHDAGHMAILPACLRELLGVGSVFSNPAFMAKRAQLLDDVTDAGANGFDSPFRFVGRSYDWEEQTAAAWSYCAALEARIDPALVFEAVTWHKRGADGRPMRIVDAGRDQLTWLAGGYHPGIDGLVDACLVLPDGFPTVARWLAQPLAGDELIDYTAA